MGVAPLAVAVPLVVAALLAAVRPVIGRRGADVLSIGASIAVIGLAIAVFVQANDGLVVIWMGGWKPVGGVAVGVAFAIDPIGAGTALLAAVLSVGALIFATRYLETTGGLFQTLMLVFLAAMVGFAYTGDLFTLFVFFELVTITAFVLVGYQIDQRAPLEGSFSFAIVNVLGSFFFLLGIALVYGRTGTLNLADIGGQLAQRPPDALVAVSFALIATGLLTKAAIVPFHFWLPDAYAVARTPVCIMLAGVMSELGLYAVARVYWSAYSGVLDVGAASLRAILVGFGVVTALVAVGMALKQTHLKRLLAFVTVAYLGLYLIGVGLLGAGGLAGSALFALGDGFIMAALFVAVGVVQRTRSHVDAYKLHGKVRDQPATAALFVIAALVMAGLPPFGSFKGKSLLEHAAVEAGYDWIVPVVIGVSLLAGAALLRAAGWIFAGWGMPQGSATSDESGDEEESGPQPFPWLMWLTGASFVAVALAIGLDPGISASALHAGQRFVDRPDYAASVLKGGAPAVAASVPRVGPDGFDRLYGAISVLGALGLAAALLRRERSPERTGRLVLAWRQAAGGVRALHSGRVGDYVAFFVLGAAVLTGLCALSFA